MRGSKLGRRYKREINITMTSKQGNRRDPYHNMSVIKADSLIFKIFSV